MLRYALISQIVQMLIMDMDDMKPLLILLQPPWWLTLNVSLWLMSPDAKSLFKLD